MSTEFTPSSRAEFEARLTALLLGEVTGAEAASLRQAIEQDAELAALYERLKKTVVLVREVAANPAQPVAATGANAPLKLSEERRQKLLAQFKTVKPKEFAPPPKRPVVSPWAYGIGIAAAIALLFVALVPNLQRARVTAQSGSIINNLRQLDGAKQEWALENKKSPDAVPTFKDIEPYMGRGDSHLPQPLAGEKYILGSVGKSPIAVIASGSKPKIYTLDEPGSVDDAKLSFQGRRLAENLALADRKPSGTTTQFGRKSVVVQSQTAPSEAQTLSRSAQPRIYLPSDAAQTAPSTPQLATTEPSMSLDASSTMSADGGASAGTTLTAQPNNNSWNFNGGKTDAASQNTGDPEWIGLLNHPEVPHSSNNPFIGSYSFYSSPAGSPQEPFVATNSVQLYYQTQPQPADSVPPPPAVPPIASAGVAPDQFAVKQGNINLGVPLASDAPAQEDTITRSPYYQSRGQVVSNGALKQEGNGFSRLRQTNALPGMADGSVQQYSVSQLKNPASIPPASVQDNANLFPLEEPAVVPPSQVAKDQNTLGLSSANADQNGRKAIAESLQRQAKELDQEALDALKPNAASVPTNEGANRSMSPLSSTTLSGYAEVNGQWKLGASNSQAPRYAYGSAAKTDGFNLNTVDLALSPPKAPVQQLAELEKSDVSVNGSLDASSRKKLYDSKKSELEQLTKNRDLLALRTFQEKVETDLPKKTMVEVVDKAQAQPSSDPTLGERISSIFGASVERKARIKLERDTTDVAGMSDRGKSSEVYDPNFVQTETEIIQSEPVLDEVIKKLNLNQTWAEKNGGKTLTMPEARRMLKSRLDIKSEKNTSLLDIGAKGDTPEEAADIAEAMAEVYRDYRKQQQTELTLLGIKQQNQQLARLDAAIHQEQAQLEDLSKNLIVTNGEPDKTDAPLPKPAAPAPEPQPEVLTSTNAFSTFSLNIADVSFKLAAASLEKGVMPEPASIRSEEFINAFDYRDPEAPPGVPVAFAWERASYPFAQNRDLLRFSLKTAATGRAPGRPLNIVLLLDNSGSMERADRVQIIHEALHVLASQLQPQDTLSIVTFARTARLFVDGVPGNQAGDAVEKVSGLTPQGGTNLEEAMRLAYETALRHYLANGVNRVVLLTDGAANLGNVDPAALKANVETHRKQGIALDCFGIGWEGYNDDLLEVLARNGDGRYGFLNSPEEAANGFAHQLAGALNVAAADVKVQVEFNPQRVTVYRQIGYAKLQLTKEQFRDNTVDAAEIGAAEAGNALYVLQVDPNGQGPLGTVRIRYKIPGTEEFHEHEWSVPYTGGALSLEQASPAMRLAASASAFSEWLANSPYAAEVTPDALLKYLSGVPAIYEPDARPKQLEWMVRQAKSVSGK